MKSFWEWRNRRLARKRAYKTLNFILEQIEKGVKVEDLFAFTVETHIQWNQPQGVWFVLTPETLREGELVRLVNGRGGRQEDARVVGVLDSECKGNIFAYSLRFDVETA